VPGATNNHAMPVIGRTRSTRAGGRIGGRTARRLRSGDPECQWYCRNLRARLGRSDIDRQRNRKCHHRGDGYDVHDPSEGTGCYVALRRPDEVLIRTRRCGSALTLVFRAYA
jgi:hypothetical protein